MTSVVTPSSHWTQKQQLHDRRLLSKHIARDALGQFTKKMCVPCGIMRSRYIQEDLRCFLGRIVSKCCKCRDWVACAVAMLNRSLIGMVGLQAVCFKQLVSHEGL